MSDWGVVGQPVRPCQSSRSIATWRAISRHDMSSKHLFYCLGPVLFLDAACIVLNRLDPILVSSDLHVSRLSHKCVLAPFYLVLP